jgi:hypothetical protein
MTKGSRGIFSGSPFVSAGRVPRALGDRDAISP